MAATTMYVAGKSGVGEGGGDEEEDPDCVTGPRRGFLEASFVSEDWRVRVFW